MVLQLLAMRWKWLSAPHSATTGPILLRDSPPVLTTGGMVMDHRCAFPLGPDEGTCLIVADGRVVGLDVRDKVLVMSRPARWPRSRPTDDPWPGRIDNVPQTHERVMDRGPPVPSRQGRGHVIGKGGSSEAASATGQPDAGAAPRDAVTVGSTSESRESSAAGRPASPAQSAPREDAPTWTRGR